MGKRLAVVTRGVAVGAGLVLAGLGVGVLAADAPLAARVAAGAVAVPAVAFGVAVVSASAAFLLLASRQEVEQVARRVLGRRGRAG
jgi:hypothetical protein